MQPITRPLPGIGGSSLERHVRKQRLLAASLLLAVIALGYNLPGVAYKRPGVDIAPPLLEPLYVPNPDQRYENSNPAMRIGSQNGIMTQEITLHPDDTLFSIFAKAGIDPTEAQPVLEACKALCSPAKLPAGGKALIDSDIQNHFKHVKMDISDEKTLDIDAHKGEILVKLEPRALESKMLSTVIHLKKSLFEDGAAAGLSDTLIAQAIQLYRHKLDLLKEIKPGDQLTLIYKGQFSQGKKVRDGVILAAEFIVNGHPLRLMRFQFPDGRIKYVDPDGRLTESGFIRTPVTISRISSYFTSARYHPILGQWRAHRGVDYAAPTGTPVIATADATVNSADNGHDYGKHIVLKYNEHITMLYGHLSAFATGIHAGGHVKMGQIIGYVGQTGLATGPHLHYELRWDGVPRDPLTMPLPEADPLPGQFQEAYQVQASEYKALLDKLQFYNQVATR